MNELQTLKIAYDGESLKNGTMDLRDLAPALLAFSGFIESVNAIVNGKNAKVAVRVKSFEKGSFGIELAVADISLLQGVIDMFSGRTATALANLIGIITGATLGVPWLIRKLRSVTKTTEKAESVTLEFSDGTTLEVSPELYRAATDATVQQNFFEALKPISKDGIDSFQIFDSAVPTDVSVEIKKSDLQNFEPIDQTEILSTDERVQFCTVTDLSFEKSEWRLSDGDSNFSVIIEDEAFLNAVRSNEITITPTTQLEAKIRTVQRRVVKNLRTNRTLLEVIKVIP